jgi:hypothetical protein
LIGDLDKDVAMAQSFFNEHVEESSRQPEREEQLLVRFELGKPLRSYAGDTKNFLIPAAIVAFAIGSILLFFSILAPPFAGYFLLVLQL